MTNPIVTLTTDFGWSDSFVGAMKGVLLSRCPGVTLVDISHNVPPQDVRVGARRLAAAAPYFPPRTVHLAVVDPGVGSGRRGLAIASGEQYFVGPDNGLLSLATANLPGDRLVVALTRSAFWLDVVSTTFHGRDVFAPVAGYLAAGGDVRELGDEVGEPVALAESPARRSPGRVDGEIVDVDRYGNLITNIAASDLGTGASVGEVCVGGKRIAGLSTWYDTARTLVAVLGGGGSLEIAAPGGSAAAHLGVGIGSPVVVLLATAGDY